MYTFMQSCQFFRVRGDNNLLDKFVSNEVISMHTEYYKLVTVTEFCFLFFCVW